MNRTLLIASVAALAITAPAQAERGGKHGDPAAEQAQPAQPAPKGKGGGRQQAQAPEQQVQQARPQFQQRARPERQVIQQQRFEQRARPERQIFQQQRFEQRARPQRQVQAFQQPRFEQRVQRARPVENRVRVQDRFVQRQARQVESGRQLRQQQVQAERFARTQNHVDRRAFGQQQARALELRGRSSIQRAQVGERFAQKQLMKEQRQAERFAGMQQRFDRRSAQLDARATQRAAFDSSRSQRWSSRPLASVGERLNDVQRQSFQPLTRDWYGDYAAQRYSSLYNSAPNSFYDYNYDDGYLYQFNRDNSLVTAMYPLLGGAFGVGQMMPIGYQSYNVPYGYRSLYYDTPDYDYRYGDGAIYRVDPDTQMIQAVVALLTGQSLGVGQMLPLGYDVYNVPYGYRDQYSDSSDMWYRYDDGYIYGVDPYSRMIETAYPVSYGGYQVGYPVPSYAGYGGYPSYAVPYGYRDLYYNEPGYNYYYANNGIYQVDPTTQLVQALVALVTGQRLGIGQMLPMGFDAYNVPYEYRSSYYDTADNWYRYDDGNIYGIDPRTRVIQSMVPVSYGGYAVGYPMPAYAGYAVPAAYDDLYYAQPGYDYRYANGGIYQIDPQTRLVQAVAALLTGQSFGTGQILPAGYDVYNVPLAYRSQYYDTPDTMYRYADGSIYAVDPRTRVIQTVITTVV